LVAPGMYPEFEVFSKGLLPNETSSNTKRTHPCALPQHMKLMNSLYEFDNEVGSILDGYSLYKSNIPLLAPQEVSRILGNFQKLGC
jgi:hypothetical protein